MIATFKQIHAMTVCVCVEGREYNVYIDHDHSEIIDEDENYLPHCELYENLLEFAWGVLNDLNRKGVR